MRRLKVYKILFAVTIGVICFSQSCKNSGTNNQEIPQTISYNFDVRPILSDKCFTCHGPDGNKRAASLRLDIGDSAFLPLKETKGRFAIVPGKPGESEIINRISSEDPTYQMPTPESHLGTLSNYEIEVLTKWIKQGAKYEEHWAFISPVKSGLPDLKSKSWVKNEIDYFILEKMEQKALSPSAEADKERLLKRLSLDLTGLPPSLIMIEDFLIDSSSGAYEKIVDRLLHSTAYGEKMALHWLDVARFGDSYGYQDDNRRTQWPWRDWLIHAFNENYPYDKFITWQLAGDMLPDANKEQILATAFLRNHKYTEEAGVIHEEYRVEYNIDKTKTYGKGILGVTIECAQCHDHKYDPFKQKDYYSLFAFFNNSKEVGFEGLATHNKPAKKPVLIIDSADRKEILNFLNYKDTAQLMVSVMGERDTLRKTYVLNRGVYDQPTDEVSAAALPAVMKFDTMQYPRNRLGLAGWTVSKSNPLTARVFVNQVWQEIFGRGILKSSSDFGMQGDLPSHPKLLDWLAVDFMENGWNIKRLVKQIVMSATYRQSARVTIEKMKIDPENIYLSRGQRQRLPAELIRDLVLSTSGLLDRTVGGPSVMPYQPKDLWESAASSGSMLKVYQQDHGPSLYRRGIYTFIKMTVPPPSMMIFDASNRDQCEVKRPTTNTPLQALVMLNDPTVLEASRVLAQRLISEEKDNNKSVAKAFCMVACRKANETEMKSLMEFFNDQAQRFKVRNLSADSTLRIGEYKQGDNNDKNTTAALMKTISMIYNLEETIAK